MNGDFISFIPAMKDVLQAKGCTLLFPYFIIIVSLLLTFSFRGCHSGGVSSKFCTELQNGKIAWRFFLLSFYVT